MTTARSDRMPDARCRRPRIARVGLFPVILAFAACSTPEPREDLEPTFKTLETGGPLEAMEASAKIAELYDDTALSRLGRCLDAAPARALQLLGELKSEGSAKLLLDRLPKLLQSTDADVVRMALVGAGLRRLRPATSVIIDRFESLDAKSALRALGRIWDRKLDDPALPRRDEIDRLTVFTLTHGIAMHADSTVEACEAMLRVMTRMELDDFLKKHAGDRFFSRRRVDEAVRKRGFDPAKGARVHEALLANPDAELVAGILASSTYELRAEAVRPLLKDERKTEDGRLLRDLAARRLKE